MDTQSEIVVHGHRGATRVSYREHNPRVLVARIMAEYPQAGVEEICRRVRKALAGRDSDFQDAFNDYATTNHFNIIQQDETTRHAKKKQTRARQTPPPLAVRIATQAAAALEAAAMLNRAKHAAVNDWLLEQVAPNGKPLGDCTGTELSQFSGYYRELAKGVGPQQKLREVKTGDDVAAARTFAV